MCKLKSREKEKAATSGSYFCVLRAFALSKSLSDIAIRHEAKERQTGA
jgi:hypothetical protein